MTWIVNNALWIATGAGWALVIFSHICAKFNILGGAATGGLLKQALFGVLSFLSANYGWAKNANTTSASLDSALTNLENGGTESK